jgi:N-acetylneuraminic acid mutarotase
VEAKPALRFLRVCVAATLIGSLILATSEPAFAGLGAWNPAGTLVTPREGPATTLLPSGKVLVAGGYSAGFGALASAELYDPATNSWSSAASMTEARSEATATLLPDGKVLVAGGSGSVRNLASAELYDPATDSWSPTGSLAVGRRRHTATLLGNGKVLVVGGLVGAGVSDSRTRAAELYDPATGTWSSAGKTAVARAGHTATLLENGQVLVAGGYGGPLASAELYDPATNTWSPAASMAQARGDSTATLLGNGLVLVAGGLVYGTTILASAELYDPATNTWSPAASMAQPRWHHTATLLGNGTVLVVGLQAPAEVYDPATNTWSSAGYMAQPRIYQTATLLENGQVLVAGGSNPIGHVVATAERYDPSAPPTTEERDPAVQFDGWVGFIDPSADFGAYRASRTAHDTARFTFSGTSVTWFSFSGPNRGMASVTIDGVSKGTFDLYTSYPSGFTPFFEGLANTSHAIVIKVLGTKNPASTDTWVPVDTFQTYQPGFTITQESSPAVKLGSWAGQVEDNASGGAYRISTTKGSHVTFPFTGTSVDWVTATGPKYGQAQVTIDGVSQGTVDLYSPTVQWQVHESYSGLSSGPHTIVVKVLGTKNPNSKGTGVVLDAFVVHG